MQYARKWVCRLTVGGALVAVLLFVWRWQVLADASQTISEARELLALRQPAAARDRVKRLLWWCPRAPAALLVVADSWLVQGEYAKAAQTFSQVPEAADEHQIASYREALAWLADARLDRAEAAFRRHFRHYEGPDAARRDYGRLLFETFQTRELETLLEGFLEQSPLDAWTLSSLLTSEFRPQPASDGLRFLDSINQRQPGQSIVERGLAYCFWQTGDLAQARQWFITSFNNDPQDLECRLMAAQFLIELNELDCAETLLETNDAALRESLATDDRWWAVRSQLAQTRGDFGRAQELIKEAIRRRPNELEYMQRAAMLHEALGHYRGGEKAYLTAGRLERCRTRLLQLIADGKVERPTAESCAEVAEQCRQRGRQRQAEGWRRLGERLALAEAHGQALPTRPRNVEPTTTARNLP